MMETEVIERDGLCFKAYRCDVCGGLDTDPKALGQHKRRHELNAAIARGEVQLKISANGVAKVQGIRPKHQCSILGCENTAKTRDLCNTHYQRVLKQKHGHRWKSAKPAVFIRRLHRLP